MFSNNGAAPLNGVVRIGDTLPTAITVVIGTREYTAYVWGKQVPRTHEAMVRQAANELDAKRAAYGEVPPLHALSMLRDAVEEALAYADAGDPAEAALAKIREAFVRHEHDMRLPVAPVPMWQEYLNRVMCGLVDGLSPLQADRIQMPEVAGLLEALHYPGFWKDPEPPLPNEQTATTATETMNPTGSTSKPELPPSVESVSPSSAP